MIQNALKIALANRTGFVVAALVLMSAGLVCFRFLKIEAYPDIADTNVIVIAQYAGRAAEEVEQQVTIPLERALNNTPRVIARRSRTIFGLAVVQLNFEDGTNDYFARQQVIERLASADLPDGVTPELGPLTTAVGEIYRYVVEAPPTFSPMDLRDLQDWVIRPALTQVSGVADVVTFGGPVKQFHVLTSPDRLRKYNLTMETIIQAVQANNLNTGGSIVERGGQGFAVRGLGAIQRASDIENIVLTTINGVPVYVRDVASVEIAPPQPQGILGYTIPVKGVDVNSGVEGIVSLRRGENPTEVLKALKERIADLQDNELPKGVTLQIIYDRSTLVDYTLETVSHTLLEGISIVVIILVLFLGDIRSALVVAITIPFSLLFAFIMMKMTGIPANLLSLGAIDFGIIVDGACVMAAHLIHTYRHAHESDEPKKSIVALTIDSAGEVGREIFFAVMIIILAYLPILTMQRVEGKLFSPMALTLAFAVMGSMLFALTLIPVLMTFVYRKQVEEVASEKKKRRTLFDRIQNRYERLIRRTLNQPRTVFLVGITVVLIVIGLGARIGTEFLPTLDEGSIFMRSFLPAGTNITENQKIAPVIRRVAARHSQIESIITQSGRNDDGTDPFPSNRTEILMILKPYGGWVHDTTKQQLLTTIKSQLEEQLPGANLSFGQPIIDQVTEIVTGSASDLAINLTGYDLTLLRSKADQVLKIVRGINGSSESGIEQEGPQAQLSININRQQVARYGINVAAIQTMIEAAIGGKVISTLYDGPRRYDIVVRYLPENRNNIDVIRNLQVPSPGGSLIPMSQLADVKLIDGQTNIYRLDGKRLVTVRTNIRGRDQGSFVAEARRKVRQAVTLPHGYGVDYGGQFENLERAGKQLMIAIPLTVVIVLAVLFLLFQSVRYALMTVVCVLFGLAGGIGALLLRGYNFNVSAGVGFVSLFGLSVMAGVLLISAINRERELGGLPLNQLVVRASGGQLRAIMMMLIVAIIGLIPAATSSGIGSDVQRPLATVIIGGLTSTLLFTPFLLPSLYFWMERNRKKKPVPAAEEVGS
ncbi:CusA/CzcA family heavy metal efflux RND transporter [Larkinella knui]|uniref:Efflux RND transporter permease subunit n=1 Tax=Larkinella knui TaxID=2025310 RepID=A0A3P1CPQ1_9BACT|nr:CusA/CzcA family heavy metal efflux RND transporter [Larkinella knui]RRB15302.1 efflux RND transporter permease subunit [Larkinella knui]